MASDERQQPLRHPPRSGDHVAEPADAPGAVTSGGGAHDIDEPEAAAYVPDAQTHGSHDANGDEHAERPLGPLDAAAWGASIVGVAAGGLVALFLYLAVA